MNGRNGMAQFLASQSEVIGLNEVPQNFRGLRFERLLSTVAFSQVTRKLETAFTFEWVRQNQVPQGLLKTLMKHEVGDTRASSVPQTDREWEVA